MRCESVKWFLLGPQCREEAMRVVTVTRANGRKIIMSLCGECLCELLKTFPWEDGITLRINYLEAS